MDEKEINRALLFASKYFNDSCHNFGKPVYFHCVKVAMKLYELGYEEKIVIGGILHDLIEDTDCTSEDIEKEFGTDLAELVDAVSFNPNIDDKLEQSKHMIDRAVAYGKPAVIIKCIDMYENGKYFHLVTKPDVKEYLIKKYKYFTDVASEIVNEEPAFKYYRDLAKNIK